MSTFLDLSNAAFSLLLAGTLLFGRWVGKFAALRQSEAIFLPISQLRPGVHDARQFAHPPEDAHGRLQVQMHGARLRQGFPLLL